MKILRYPHRGNQRNKTSLILASNYTHALKTSFQPEYPPSPNVVGIRLFRQQTLPAHHELRDGRASDLTPTLKILISNLELDVEEKRIYCSELQARLIN